MNGALSPRAPPWFPAQHSQPPSSYLTDLLFDRRTWTLVQRFTRGDNVLDSMLDRRTRSGKRRLDLIALTVLTPRYDGIVPVRKWLEDHRLKRVKLPRDWFEVIARAFHKKHFLQWYRQSGRGYAERQVSLLAKDPFEAALEYVGERPAYFHAAIDLVIPFFAHPGQWMSDLTALNVTSKKLRAEELARLLASPHFPCCSLSTLMLGNNPSLGAEGAAAVAECPQLSGLTHLELQGTRMGRAGVESVLSSPHLAGLTELDLSRTCVFGEVEQVIDFSLCSHFSRLRTLRLCSNSLGPGNAASLASAGEHLTTVRTLDMSVNPLGRAGAAALLGSRALSGVTDLDLSLCGLEGPSIEAMLRGFSLGSLRALKLDRNFIRDTGVTLLAESPAVEQLESLSLYRTGLGPEGAGALASSPFLGRLRHLDLSHNRLGLEGVEAVTRGRSFTSLQTLALADVRIDNGDFPYELFTNELCTLTSLRRLDVGPVSCRWRARDVLREAPNLPHFRNLVLYKPPRVRKYPLRFVWGITSQSASYGLGGPVALEDARTVDPGGGAAEGARPEGRDP